MFPYKPGKFIVIFALLLMLAPGASAQINSLVPGTITVVGEGFASAPAETADVAISIGPDSNMYVDPMAIEPDVSSVPELVDASGVVDAIIAHGVPVNDVTVIEPPFFGEWGAGMTAQPVTILVHIIDPTVEDLSELLDVVRAAAFADGLYVNQFGVAYGVSDCRALRQQARADAVANARSEAEDQAAAMDTTLGDAVASRDTYPMNPGYFPTNSCINMPEAKGHSIAYMAGQFDPSLPAVVVVMVSMEVSFDIP